jgi:hypothetical protein
MVKLRRASAVEVCRAASVPHAVSFKQQLGSEPRIMASICMLGRAFCVDD